MLVNSKLKLLVFLFVCLTGFLSSCADDPVDLEGRPEAVAFTPTLVSEVSVDVNDAPTRVVNNKWSGTEVVGIQMVPAGGSISSTTFNKYNAAAGTAGAGVALTAQTGQGLYFPMNGSTVDFYAFSPHKTPDANYRVTYSATDQNNQAKLEAVDFIWAKAQHAQYNKEDKKDVALAFTHKQCKIKITVTADTNNGVTATDMATPKLTIGSMPYGGTYNLSTGELYSIYGSNTITPFNNTASPASTTNVIWEAIVPPHDGASYTSRKFNFTFNSIAYSHTLATSQNYVAGYVYNYTFTLTKAGLKFTGCTVADWEAGGNIVWSDKHHLIVSESEVNLYKEAITGNTLSVKTSHTGTVTAKRSNNATTVADSNVSWLSNPVVTGSQAAGYAVTYNVDANGTGAARTGYIHISVDAVMTAVVKVVQGKDPAIDPEYEGLKLLVEEDANCFIVSPGKSVVIPVTRAFTNGHINMSTSATLVPTILWTDTQNLIKSVKAYGTGADAVLLVETKDILTKGNGVVALRANSATGTIYWSWHIWVTDDPTATTYTHTNANGTFTFMDRNLGATSGTMPTVEGDASALGMHYQWGRKDPFPSSSSNAASEDRTLYGDGTTLASTFNVQTYATPVETTGTSMANAIQNPWKFYHTPKWSDWCSDDRTTTSTRWNSTANTKTLYDPCPAGWRVPMVGAFAAFDTYYDNALVWISSPCFGFYSIELGWWPSTGVRWGAFGSFGIGGVGMSGSYYTGTTSEHASGSLGVELSPNFIDISAGHNRPFGGAVRCKREL